MMFVTSKEVNVYFFPGLKFTVNKLFMLSMLGKNFSRQHFEIYFCLIFSQQIGLDISCKLSGETICMKCQSLLSRKNKKNIINLSYAEFVNSMVKW